MAQTTRGPVEGRPGPFFPYYEVNMLNVQVGIFKTPKKEEYSWGLTLDGHSGIILDRTNFTNPTDRS